MQHPAALQDLSSSLAKILSPSAPVPLRLMAADGMAPLPPADLLTVLYVFSYGEDEALSRRAKDTFGKLPEAVIGGGLEQLARPEVLDGVEPLLVGRPAMVRKLLLNKSLADETAVAIARSCADEATLELLAANETRLLACPTIIEAFYHNKSARMSTVDKIVELAVRAGLELSGISSFEQIKAAILGQAAQSEPTLDPDVDDEVHVSLLQQESEDVDEATVSAILEASPEEIAEEQEETKLKIQSLMQSLAKLNISSKIRVATLGNVSQRAVLIRDSNKLVVMAVIQSPGIRDSEIVLYSRYRTLPDDAIRFIARNREWTKHYTVKLNLVQNPRTPLEFALRFLPHLRASELRSIERDKNVSGAVSKAARELRSKRSH